MSSINLDSEIVHKLLNVVNSGRRIFRDNVPYKPHVSPESVHIHGISILKSNFDYDFDNAERLPSGPQDVIYRIFKSSNCTSERRPWTQTLSINKTVTLNETVSFNRTVILPKIRTSC